jgi:hypothetical protein
MKTVPLLLRDFSRGTIRKYSASESLVPVNSTAHSINVNYDTTIGKATVRPGTTLIGAAVSTGKTPLGLTEANMATNIMVAVFKGATTPTAHYFNGTAWGASSPTLTSNTAKCRFAVLGNRVFLANGTDSMQSSADGSTWASTNCTFSPVSVVPSLIYRSKARLLASGWSSLKSRVYFSSVIDSSLAITWNTTAADGDWIDINPDDGGYVTGFGETSNQTLVFKSNGMYRMNVISKTVDVENIFQIGAVSQESIIGCQGIVYFFSGQDIRRTNGGIPEQISRLGVQEWINAIPQANWADVCSGTDGFNVFFSIGNITLNANKNEQKTYSNVVLKFSTRDESWSVHSYAQRPMFYCQYTNSTNGRKVIEVDTAGLAQTVDSGLTDNTAPIYYELETQECEMGNRAHLKSISDKIVVFGKYMTNGKLQVKTGEDDYVNVDINLNSRVAMGKKINAEGYYYTFRWFGESSSTAPMLEGIYIENIEDKGIIEK